MGTIPKYLIATVFILILGLIAYKKLKPSKDVVSMTWNDIFVSVTPDSRVNHGMEITTNSSNGRYYSCEFTDDKFYFVSGTSDENEYKIRFVDRGENKVDTKIKYLLVFFYKGQIIRNDSIDYRGTVVKINKQKPLKKNRNSTV